MRPITRQLVTGGPGTAAPVTSWLPVDRPVQHHAGHADGDDQRGDHPDRVAGHLPQNRGEPAAAGQRQPAAVDDPGLPVGHRGAGGDLRPTGRHVRPGAGLQPGFRGVHGVLHPAGGDLAARHGGRAVADRDADLAGRCWGDAARQRGGDPHRRRSRRNERGLALGPQPGRRARRGSRPGWRRACRLGPVEPAAGVPGVGAGSVVFGTVLGLPEPARARRAHARSRSGPAGRPHLRGRAGRGAGRDHLRHPALWRATGALGWTNPG